MKKNNKGFTLIEILAVIAIIGIIGVIATRGVLKSVKTGKETTYKLMINNIYTASQTLYEEIEYKQYTSDNTKIYRYETTGRTNQQIKIVNQKIDTNLQTLVSNGFVIGNENKCDDIETCTNTNKRKLQNPETKDDIGECEITIEKQANSKYVITNKSTSNSICPTEYKKEVK